MYMMKNAPGVLFCNRCGSPHHLYRECDYSQRTGNTANYWLDRPPLNDANKLNKHKMDAVAKCLANKTTKKENKSDDKIYQLSLEKSHHEYINKYLEDEKLASSLHYINKLYPSNTTTRQPRQQLLVQINGIDDTDYSSLCDSGASISVVSLNIVKQLGLTINAAEPGDHLLVANGSRINRLGTVLLMVTIKRSDNMEPPVTMAHEFEVMDNNVNFILGVDILRVLFDGNTLLNYCIMPTRNVQPYIINKGHITPSYYEHNNNKQKPTINNLILTSIIKHPTTQGMNIFTPSYQSLDTVNSVSLNELYSNKFICNMLLQPQGNAGATLRKNINKSMNSNNNKHTLSDRDPSPLAKRVTRSTTKNNNNNNNIDMVIETNTVNPIGLSNIIKHQSKSRKTRMSAAEINDLQDDEEISQSSLSTETSHTNTNTQSSSNDMHITPKITSPNNQSEAYKSLLQLEANLAAANIRMNVYLAKQPLSNEITAIKNDINTINKNMQQLKSLSTETLTTPTIISNLLDIIHKLPIYELHRNHNLQTLTVKQLQAVMNHVNEHYNNYHTYNNNERASLLLFLVNLKEVVELAVKKYFDASYQATAGISAHLHDAPVNILHQAAIHNQQLREQALNSMSLLSKEQLGRKIKAIKKVTNKLISDYFQNNDMSVFDNDNINNTININNTDNSNNNSNDEVYIPSPKHSPSSDNTSNIALSQGGDEQEKVQFVITDKRNNNNNEQLYNNNDSDDDNNDNSGKSELQSTTSTSTVYQLLDDNEQAAIENVLDKVVNKYHLLNHEIRNMMDIVIGAESSIGLVRVIEILIYEIQLIMEETNVDSIKRWWAEHHAKLTLIFHQIQQNNSTKYETFKTENRKDLVFVFHALEYCMNYYAARMSNIDYIIPSQLSGELQHHEYTHNASEFELHSLMNKWITDISNEKLQTEHIDRRVERGKDILRKLIYLAQDTLKKLPMTEDMSKIQNNNLIKCRQLYELYQNSANLQDNINKYELNILQFINDYFEIIEINKFTKSNIPQYFNIDEQEYNSSNFKHWKIYSSLKVDDLKGRLNRITGIIERFQTNLTLLLQYLHRYDTTYATYWEDKCIYIEQLLRKLIPLICKNTEDSKKISDSEHIMDQVLYHYEQWMTKYNNNKTYPFVCHAYSIEEIIGLNNNNSISKIMESGQLMSVDVVPISSNDSSSSSSTSTVSGSDPQ